MNTLTLVADALAQEPPVRARYLAARLDLPRDVVRADLRTLQDRGLAHSHDQRWTAVREDSHA